MANLYLDGIFDSKSSASPSTVRLLIPNVSKATGLSLDLTGIMIGDPTISLQNKWGPIINDISNLTDLSSLVGSNSLFTWIAASTNCWKGTAPISVSISFYLINYKRTGLNFESKLKALAKLAAIGESAGALEGVTSTVHGGYAADIFKSNKSFFTDLKGLADAEDGANILGAVDAHQRMYSTGSTVEGSVMIIFGNKNRIGNLLLTKLDVTESTIEVADQGGGSRKPLFYKVDAQFVGVSPMTTAEVDNIFTGGGG